MNWFVDLWITLGYVSPTKHCFVHQITMNGPPRLSICHQRAVHKRWTMLAHCNKKQNMCFSSKQSSLYSFYALPSGGKSKDAVVHFCTILKGGKTTEFFGWSLLVQQLHLETRYSMGSTNSSFYETLRQRQNSGSPGLETIMFERSWVRIPALFT